MQQVINGTINFTMEIKELIQQLLCDPQARQEILLAIQEGPKQATKPVGFANLGDQGNTDFWSVFLSTVQGAQAGQMGYLYRNQTGNRIGVRLRRQPPKNQLAQASQQGNVHQGGARAANVLPQQLPLPALPNVGQPQGIEQVFRGGPDALTKAFQGDPAAAQELLNLVAQRENQAAQQEQQPEQQQAQLPNNFQEALSEDAPEQPKVPDPFEG